MKWSGEDVESAWETTRGMTPRSADATRAIMTRAVELVAARGGTMTAEGLKNTLTTLHHAGGPGMAEDLRRHTAAQGARLAVAEQERDALKAQVEALQAAGAVLSAHVDKTAGEAPRHTCEDGADPTCLRCAEDDKARECDHALCGDLCTKYADPEDIALTKGYDDGIEAMRAACWEDIQELAFSEGWCVHGDKMWAGLKAAIEGATP